MTLDPRHPPRSYAETLQDIVDMQARLERAESTRERYMALLLEPSAAHALDELRRIGQAAAGRMVGPQAAHAALDPEDE